MLAPHTKKEWMKVVKRVNLGNVDKDGDDCNNVKNIDKDKKH